MAPVKSRARRPVTDLYPKVASGVSKGFQMIAAGVVVGIMFTFIGRLNDQHFAVPWMFFFLQGAALATALSGILMGIWHCWRPNTIRPWFLAIVSGLLFGVWAAGTGLLINAMQDTITRPCTTVYWGNDTGVYVCVLYKILLAGAAVGTLSTLACLILDVRAARKEAAMKVKSIEGENLLAKGAGNGQYIPVWAEEQTAYASAGQGTPVVRTG